jgi:hypothetical protein
MGANFAHAVSGEKDVYHLCGRLADKPQTGRGKESDVCAVSGESIDPDIKGPGHKETALPSQEELLDHLKTFPQVPSIVVHSGGGCMCTTCLKSPGYLKI